MKKFTHPPISYTFIRCKNGSSYNKYWRYLRPTLVLEGSSKAWDSDQHSKNRKVFSFKVAQSAGVASISANKVNRLSFWQFILFIQYS